MEKRQLGKTNLEVSRLGMGGLFIATKNAEFKQAHQAVHRAIELGVTYADTAPNYMDSEKVLGQILQDIHAPLILSTKLGGRPQPFEPQNRTCLEQSVEESLRLLNRDHIDIFIIHEPDRPRQYDWWTDPEHFNGPALDLLQDLKKDGTISAIGIGGTTAYEMTDLIRTGKFDVVLTAFNYSLLWREAEHEVLPAATEQGMGIIVGSPLQQGALARRYDDLLDNARWLSPPRRNQYRALYAFLDEINMPIAECAIRFVISNPHIHTTLMGARSTQEVESNIAAIEKGPLPTDILNRLDDIAALVPFRPFCEPFGLPFGRPYKGPGQA
jgi:aryl-alcohol dehydrogenase-like predicted oxidoreductase